MYSEDDLRDAVAAGAISAEAAQALRDHVSALREAPVGDEESFRLITSFNDVFVTIATVMLLIALGTIGAALDQFVSALLVAGASWGLAEFFTLKRRMALPSIVLLITFVGGVLAALGVMLIGGGARPTGALLGVLGAVTFAGGAGAAYLHWWRFKVPITVAAGAGSLVGVAFMLIAAVLEESGIEAMTIFLPLAFVSGLAIFAFAMWWDMSDRQRQTRRSDVAFWLHLLAAPLIVHPVFQWLGVISGGEIGSSKVLAVLVIYLAMALVAVIVDRRALLVSALAYVLIAVTWLFDRFGAVELNVALTSLVIGSALLCLSAFWSPLRRAVVSKLPETVRERVPVLGVVPN